MITILNFLVFVCIMLVVTLGISIKKLYDIVSKDRLIIIDKNNRWNITYINLKGKDQVKIKNKAYFLKEEAGLLNNKGKALYVFSENKPTPLSLNYSKIEWLDSESLMGVINNKLVQQIVRPTDAFKDSLMLFGAIGGMIAGLSSVFLLLQQLGVINV